MNTELRCVCNNNNKSSFERSKHFLIVRHVEKVESRCPNPSKGVKQPNAS